MFTGQYIAIAFLTMFAAIGAFLLIEKRRWLLAERPVLLLGLVASGYCIAAGLFLLSGWQDPLGVASSLEVAHAATSHGGRGGVAILVIRFWPYVLIGLGSYCGYYYILIFKHIIQSQRT
jgi:hypothetical protein